ncbi:MAG: hypothetical protein H6Q10_2495 [Acidobacteria bacterium]|nr:hypothetical protein [Acidobacteriota bacterium]
MIKRTRYFLIGSVAFLALGLVAGLVAYYGGIPGAVAQAGVDELRYVPSDAVVVAYADVDNLMNSHFRQAVKDIEPGEPKGRDEFQQETGIDIEKDVDYVVACLLPQDAAGPNGNKTGYVLAKGNFDRARIEGLLLAKGGQKQDYRGKTFYTAPEGEAAEGAEQHERPALVFLENDVVAVGTPAAVKRAVDLQFGGQNVLANEDLAKMIRGVDQGNAWAVGRFDVLTRNAHLPSEISDRIPPITWFSAMGHVNGGVSGRLAVEARDEAAAENLRQVVNGFMALARLQAGSGTSAKQGELNAMLNSIQLEGDGKTVAVSFSMPAEALEMLKSKR